MSSVFVRQSILDYLAANSAEVVADFTADFEQLSDFLELNNIADQQPWVGIQFVGSQEVAVDIRATDSKGKYRENGVIYLHIVDIAKLGVHNLILNRAEILRSKFRGKRIAGTILIESVSPANFGAGVTLSFEGGYTAALVQIDYQRDFDL